MPLPIAAAALGAALATASPTAPAPSEALLTLERTGRRLPHTGDPIWDLRLEVPGEAVRHFEAVKIGRAHV